MSEAFAISLGLLWLLACVIAFLLMGIARSAHADVEKRREGVTGDVAEDLTAFQAAMKGQRAPTFRAEELEGEVISNGTLLGKPAVLLFVSPDCLTCGGTLGKLNPLVSRLDGAFLVMCRSQGNRCGELKRTYDLTVPVVVDDGMDNSQGMALSRLFNVAGTPTAVLLNAKGEVVEHTIPMSAEALEEALLAANWSTRAEAPVTS